MEHKTDLFGTRYEPLRRLWYDGPFGGELVLDRVLSREVIFCHPYRPDRHESFRQMVQIRASLRHTNLPPIYDAGTNDGCPFFTEPYIAGTDLRTLLAEDTAGDVTLPELLWYLRDVCKAAAFLHTNGYLHLHLYPDNVVVVRDTHEVFVMRGRPASVAPVSASQVKAPHQRERAISPQYTAPEQLDPEGRGAPDHLTDVYGLGAILFEVLYEEPPNGRGDPIEIMTALMKREGPPSPGRLSSRSARHPVLAKRLETICLRALDADRGARQPSVSAFANDVEMAMTMPNIEGDAASSKR